MAGTWTAVPTNAVCGDGTNAVWGVNPAPAAVRTGCLVIYGRGQGLCDASSGDLDCFSATSPAMLHYTAADLAADAAPASPLFGYLATGIFDAATSPIRACDWVTIPTCTADAWTGNADRVYGTTTVHHRGAALFTTILTAIHAQFPSPTRVGVLGFSAGGMGSILRAGDYAAAWPGVPLSIVNDSGTWVRPPYLTIALQQQMLGLWGATLPAGCPSCAPVTGDDSTGLHNAFAYAASIAPTAYLGTLGDGTVSGALSAGNPALRCSNSAPYNAPPNCEWGLTPHSPRAQPASLDLVTQLAAAGTPAYLASGGPACATCPAGTGNWWQRHGLASGKPSVPVALGGFGPVQQSGCDAVAWAAAHLRGLPLPAGCTSQVR